MVKTQKMVFTLLSAVLLTVASGCSATGPHGVHPFATMFQDYEPDVSVESSCHHDSSSGAGLKSQWTERVAFVEGSTRVH